MRHYLIAFLTIILSAISFGQEIDMHASVTRGCAGTTVVFTDSTIGATLWEWDFGNGKSSTATVNQPLSTIYSTPGFYTATLRINNTTTDSIIIEIVEDPQIDFSVPRTSSCPPLNTEITDLTTSSTGIVSWFWSFGDGTNSDEQNPSVSYEFPGTYNLFIEVEDSLGCTSDTALIGYFEVLASPTAVFTGTDIVSCEAPITASFDASATLATGNVSYEWDFGDGSTGTAETLQHEYTSSGTYDVSLIVNDDTGCPDTLTLEGYVGVEPMIAGFDYEVNGCGPATVTFIDTSGPSPNSWNWTFIGGDISSSTSQNPTVTFPNSGGYSVSLTASNDAGCTDVQAEIITISPPPTAIFSSLQTYSCSTNFEVTFQDFSNGAESWEWDFGDGNTSNEQHPVHVYESAGSFNVSLTVYNADGCSNTSTRNNFIEIVLPEANFGADVLEGCINLPVNFTDSSTSNENIVSWEWDFGDGNTSSQQNPSHVFTQEGYFNISLIIENSSGCVDTFLAEEFISAGGLPVVDFEANLLETCADTIIQFTNLSTAGTEFEWSFGDGGTSDLENAIHMYADTGDFDIQLIVSNYGCRDSLTKNEYLKILPPIAIFLPTFNCNTPYTFSFEDFSIDPQAWVWDFGDGQSSSSGGIVNNTYDTAGIYQVTLTVTNGACVDEAIQTIVVAEPTAGFTVDSLEGCIPFSPTFEDTSDQAIFWSWEFSDGGIGNGETPTHVFTTPGFYDVLLAVTAANGCTDTIRKTDYIEALGPVVDFSVLDNQICETGTADFTNLSTAKDGIASQMWYFGDGDSSADFSTRHVYDSAAIYQLALSVTDNNNCTVIERKSSFVFVAKPVANIFGGDLWECPNYEIQFINSSQPGPTGGAMSYVWDFGDGTTSTLTNPTHTYTSSDSFTVTLYVDLGGCLDTVEVLADVRIPNIGIVANDSSHYCAPVNIQFDALTDVNGGTWEWDFGNGAVGYGASVSNPYFQNGLFDIDLTYSASGSDCEVSITEQEFIEIIGPKGDFTFTPNDDCAPLEITFTVTSEDALFFTYDYGDGSVDEMLTVQEVSHIYTVGDTIIPEVYIYDNNTTDRCEYRLPLFDTVRVSNIPVNAGPDTILCPGQGVILSMELLGEDAAEEITWLISDSVISSGLATTQSVVPNGSSIYSVQVEDEVGCVVTKQINVQVDSIVAAFGSSTGYCPGDSVQLSIDTSSGNGLGGALSFSWSPTAGISNPSISNPFASPTTVTDYVLTVSDTLGCSVNTDVQVLVYENPNVTVDNSAIEICYGEFGEVSAFGASSYAWSPSVGVNDPSFSNVVFNALEITNDQAIVPGDAFRNYAYTLIGTNDSTGCMDTVDVTVKVRALPLIIQPDDTAFCYGDSVSLTIDGEDTYVWFPFSSLSDSAGQTVVATPDLDEVYKIIGVDAFGCKDTSEEVFIDVHDLPVVDYLDNDTILQGMEVPLENRSGDGGHTYTWDESEGLSDDVISNPVSQPTETIRYIVTVATKTEPSCIVLDTIDIVVYDEVIIAVPTAFTPNGDMSNELLKAYAKGMDNLEFKIFNRWGQIVFETSNLNEGWDGTFRNNGQPVPMDTYSFVIKGDDLLGNPHVQKGQITIIK